MTNVDLSVTYTKKSIRLGSEYHELLKWLEYDAKRKDVSYKDYLSSIFNYSLHKIENEGCHYIFSNIKYTRSPKGIYINTETMSRLYLKHSEIGEPAGLNIADWTELLLFLYCIDKFNKNTLSKFNFQLIYQE